MDTKLTILYQDEWLVAIDKPAGYLVHPAEIPQPDDLVAMKILRDQLGKRVNTIHRIDRPTSGVLLFGIEKQATKMLHKSLEQHNFDKSYWAVVQGLAPANQWECHEPIQKDLGATVRDAHTSFRVLDSVKVKELAGRVEDCAGHGDTLTLLEAIPHSGRFHQIRRHLLEAKIPIVGDYRYAGIDRSDQLGQLLSMGTRMLLQANALTIVHPVTNHILSIKAPATSYIKKYFPSLMEHN